MQPFYLLILILHNPLLKWKINMNMALTYNLSSRIFKPDCISLSVHY